MKQYRRLHSERKFPGFSMLQYIPRIAELVADHRSKSILDYGCGLGEQYFKERAHLAIGIEIPTLYDPGVEAHCGRPRETTYDGVICTDVLEHVPEVELREFVDDIARFAKQWAFFSVCCRPSKHITFKDGTNVHVTIKPFAWWDEFVRERFAHQNRYNAKVVLVESP